MFMQGVLITTDTKVKIVEPKDGKRFTLEELQGFVGGRVDIQTLPDFSVIYVNDDGKNIGLPKNAIATEIWKAAYPIEKYPHNNDQLIVGDVLILSEEAEAEENREEDMGPCEGH
ncbi:MAG: DUF3846 domain-containing protein [Candidatus Omnitrophota bacterium]